MGEEERRERRERRFQLCSFGFYLLVGPVEDSDFRPAIPAEWQKGPSEAAIDVQAMPGVLVSSGNPASATGWKPERRDSGNLPLTAVTVSAQDQVDGMILVHHVEYVRCMGQEQGKAAVRSRRNALKIGAMERRIIDADDRQARRTARPARRCSGRDFPR